MKPTRWSWSSWNTWRKCPAQYKFSYIDAIPWPSAPAASRGTRMHKMAEDFVTGAVPSVPHEIQKIGPQLLVYQSRGAKSEAVWLLDKDWRPTQDPGSAWIKAIVDVHFFESSILYVTDYKSGQMYDDHLDQLELYGLVGLCVYPEAKRVETSALYMDTGHEGMQGSIIRPMMAKMMDRWNDGAKAMMEDETFEPKPGVQCRWCPYAKSKGGACAEG